ncbi:response regulator [Desulforhopalus vacuolatus]|uniref:response regulator n=1 Tax=Desulforhopalus vacuolatus TaxID=40414 RepID=UPI00196462F2|nr:response regulator [Desulforhopalus vacuolatus]MBM9519029.1 response regulator [Desulforhopalus vacuolatus]
MLKILIVDDSLVFRRFLGDIFEDCDNIEIAGEASNGIEALEMLLRVKPDVILLDLEMPLMNGMTALQHFMIHCPTPTIMFSSLTEEGTARCFDTLKNGAVYFFNKDFIFQRSNLSVQKQLLVEKVEKAGNMVLLARDPFAARLVPEEYDTPGPQTKQWVLFCEECGHRQIVDIDPGKSVQYFTCSSCGDQITYTLPAGEQVHQELFVSFLIGGCGSFSNLLSILPSLDNSFTGSIICFVESGHDNHLKSFVEYLDSICSIRVLRADEGMSIDSGTCYLLSCNDNMSFISNLTQAMLQKNTTMTEAPPLDILLASAADTFKDNTSVYFLSGRKMTVGDGLKTFAKSPDRVKLLLSEECLFPELTGGVSESIGSDLELQQLSTARIIESLHSLHRDVGSAA